MQTNTKEVYFNGYCDTCKYKNIKSTSDPCNECLSSPFNVNTHEPVMYESKNPVTMIDKIVKKTLEKGMNVFPIIDDKKQSTRTVYSSKKTENRISEEIEKMNPLTI